MIAKKNKKLSIDEISPIIFSIPNCYSSLLKTKIAQIYKNYFRYENLYKFHHLKGCKNINKDSNIIFKYSQIKSQKVTTTLRDFGKTIEILSENFLNYFMVMINFFKVTFFFFFYALLNYYSKIYYLNQIYNWQYAVFFLAIDYHSKIIKRIYIEIKA